MVMFDGVGVNDWSCQRYMGVNGRNKVKNLLHGYHYIEA